jgi:dopamine D1-like receptor
MNITEICLKNASELSDKEFDIWLDGYCDPPTSTERPTEQASLTLSTTAYVAYYSMLISGGIILNLLVMITIFSRNRLRTIPNAFMISLSVADFLLATVAIPLRLVERLNRNISYDNITPILYPCIGAASILSLCFVTLDRYMHIRHPLNYEKHMNKKRAIGIVAGLWVFSILQALVFFLVQENRFHEAIYNDARLVICFVIPTIFISVTYTKLFLIARSHARVIAATSVTFPHRSWSQKKDFKILKVIALIVGTFVLSWPPFLVAVSYELHHQTTKSRNFLLYMDIAECIACSTCVLNPFIYGWLRRDLRMSMRYVVACKRESTEERESP